DALRDGLVAHGPGHRVEDRGAGRADWPAERRRVQALLLVPACRHGAGPCLDAALHARDAGDRARHPQAARGAPVRLAAAGRAMSAAAITVAGLQKQFGSLSVLRDLDLSVADKEFVCILGPSGSGKSTLLNVIAGLETDYTGSVVLGTQRIGYLFQEPRLL